MEYNLSKHAVSRLSNFLDTVNEQLVDFDVTLPDYCPDIEKILKCTLIPKIYTRSISGGQLTVEGVAVVRILYCDSIRHHIRSFEQSQPFSATFNLKSTPEQYIVLCDTKCEYVNCRALSPRKLVVHGAFSLYAKVLCKDSETFHSFDEESDLQAKLRDISVSDLCALCQEQFSILEDITISNKPPVESLLSFDVDAHITDLKSVSNKLMLNAELTLKAMYLSDLDSGNTEHITYVFPISRIIDCDGIMEDTVNIPTLEVMSYDLHIRKDSINDGSLLSLDVKLCFSDISYLSKTMRVIEDAYSTEFLTENKHSSKTAQSNHSFEKFSNIAKTTVKLDSCEISKILNIYSQGLKSSVVISDKELSVVSKANVCMLVEDTKGEISYIERSVDVDFKPSINRSFDKAMLNSANVHSLSYRLADGNTIEVRIELRFTITLCDSHSLNCVTYINALEDKPCEKDDCSLILYFADKGESVWDIAKAYSTKSDLLMSENALENDILEEECMLLVPTR